MLDVLVDFDNIPAYAKRTGLAGTVEEILRAVGTQHFVSDPTIRFRLYGGWYQDRVLTRAAQSIIAQAALFPSIVTVSAPTKAVVVRAQVEPAYSLEAEPMRHLFNTYRPGGAPEGLRCRHPSDLGCGLKTNCPLSAMHFFIGRRRCPNSECAVDVSPMLTYPQQKLVDTMLTADIIHLARTGAPKLVVVSSDDDLWPGIRTACLLGSTVVHVQTRDRSTPEYYVGPPDRRYLQVHL